VDQLTWCRTARKLICAAVLLAAVPAVVSAAESAREGARESAASKELVFVRTEPFRERELRRVAGPAIEEATSGAGSPSAVADAVYQIEQWVRSQGYPEAEATYSMINETPAGDLTVESSRAWALVDRVEVVLEPGPRVVLGSVSFPGAAAFSPERLREFFPGGRRPVYRESQVQSGINEVSRLYVVNGYADHSVGPPQIERRREEGTTYFDVRVPVTEGPRYRIEAVELGGTDLSREQRDRIRGAIELEGSLYFPRKLAEAEIAVRNVLGAQGYDATVDHTSTLRDTGAAAVKFNIDPGPQLILRDVTVRNTAEGELRTSGALIRSYVDLPHEQPIDLPALNAAERELYGLGVFALVDVYADPASQAQNANEVPATVIVEVSERRTQSVEVELGWGSYEQIRAAAGYTDRNLFGLALRWSVEAHGSFKTYGGQTSLSHSHLFGASATVTAGAAYAFRDARSFDHTRIEGEIGASYRVNPSWSLGGSYLLRSSRADNIEGEIEGVEVPRVAEGRVTLSARYDTRDSLVTPERGTYLMVAPLVSVPALGSDIFFTGIDAEAHVHASPAPRITTTLVGAYRTRYRLDRRDTLPIQERLFLGGPNSVRSYGSDELGLTDGDGVPQGGMTTLLGTLEVRVRVIAELHLAVFYDLGFMSARSFRLDGDFGHGVGSGLRYHLPVGPIRLDVAYNPGRTYAADGRWTLHFAVGFSY
jgi:outer membrane protein assembly factor BamA